MSTSFFCICLAPRERAVALGEKRARSLCAKGGGGGVCE